MADSYFTVVQYLPDPVAGERINIGVLTYGAGRVYCRFLNDWTRVRRFSGRDIQFLQDFALRVKSATSVQAAMELAGTYHLNEQKLSEMIGRWDQSIQFTEPCGAVIAADALLAMIGPDYLREPERKKKHSRTRIEAAQLAADRIQSAVVNRVGKEGVAHLLKRRYELPGELEPHVVDVALANGHPLLAAQGVSFELLDSSDLRRATDSVKYLVGDLRRRNADLRLAVVVLPPTTDPGHQAYKPALQIFERLGAQVVTEQRLEEWADQEVSMLPREVIDHVLRQLPESSRQAARPEGHPIP